MGKPPVRGMAFIYSRKWNKSVYLICHLCCFSPEAKFTCGRSSDFPEPDTLPVPTFREQWLFARPFLLPLSNTGLQQRGLSRTFTGFPSLYRIGTETAIALEHNKNPLANQVAIALPHRFRCLFGTFSNNKPDVLSVFQYKNALNHDA